MTYNDVVSSLEHARGYATGARQAMDLLAEAHAADVVDRTQVAALYDAVRHQMKLAEIYALIAAVEVRQSGRVRQMITLGGDA